MAEQSMVERVAKALFESAVDDRQWANADIYAYKDTSLRELYLAKARAAIDAMREPTAEMIGAMEDSYQPDEVWRAMIDAALAPRKQCDKPT